MTNKPHHGGIAADQLKSFIQRIERLEEEKVALCHDIKEVYSEAKGTGFDAKIMKKIIRMRKMDAEKLAEEEALVELYMGAIQPDLFPMENLTMPTPKETALQKAAIAA